MLAAAGVLYAAFLDRFGFWGDELQTFRAITRDLPGMVRHRLENGHLPLFFALEWGWARLFGTGEAVLRAPAAAASLLSGVLVYATAARLARPAAGVAAAVLFLALPVQTSIALQARPNTAFQCLVLLATWWLVTSDARPLAATARRYAVTAWLALCTHFAAHLAVASQLGLLAGAPRPTRRLVRAAAAAFAAILPLVVALLLVAEVDQRLGWTWRRPDPGPLGIFALPYLPRLPDPPPWLPAAVASAALAAVGARRAGDRGLPVAALWLGPPLLATLLAATGAFDVTRVYRYFAASWAAQAIFLGIAVGATPGRLRLPAVVAVAAAAALLALSVHETERLLRLGEHEPWRQVARRIEAGRGPDEVVALLPPGDGNFSVPLFYMEGGFYDLRRPYHRPYTPETYYRDQLRARADVLRRGFLDAARRLDREPRVPQPWLPEGTRGVWVYLGRDPRSDAMARVAWEYLMDEFPHEEELPVRRGRLHHRWRGEPGSARSAEGP